MINEWRDRDVSRRRENGQFAGRGRWPLAGQFFEHSSHLLRPGHPLFNADAHLQHPLVIHHQPFIIERWISIDKYTECVLFKIYLGRTVLLLKPKLIRKIKFITKDSVRSVRYWSFHQNRNYSIVTWMGFDAFGHSSAITFFFFVLPTKLYQFWIFEKKKKVFSSMKYFYYDELVVLLLTYFSWPNSNSADVWCE